MSASAKNSSKNKSLENQGLAQVAVSRANADKKIRKNLLLIVMGGIAAYKTPQLCRELRWRGFNLRVVMTKNASRFVTSGELTQASKQAVSENLFAEKNAEQSAEKNFGQNLGRNLGQNLGQDFGQNLGQNRDENMAHIELARWAHIVLIAPATANGLARLAHGICDDLASTTLLALKREIPIFAAPAMNPQMWQNPATRHNVALLKEREVKMIGPCIGLTACGEVGLGRMSEPVEIAKEIDEEVKQACLKESLLEGVRILITAGATIEKIDPVRYISNKSSGRQGFALAKACAERGAQVLLIAGHTLVQAPTSQRIKVIRVESAAEMARATIDCLTNPVRQKTKKFEPMQLPMQLPMQVAICAAAVADFRPQKQFKLKPAKKTLAGKIDLLENRDILAEIASLPKGVRPQIVIGFAAETSYQIKEKLLAKQKTKKCDWLIANDVLNDSVFNSEFNRVQILDEKGEVEALPRMTKLAVANHIACKVARYLKDWEKQKIEATRKNSATANRGTKKIAAKKIA